MKGISTIISQSRIVREGNNEYIIKYYDSIVSLKWFFVVSAFRVYPYVSNPKERMKRELEFFTYRWDGKVVNVPKIVDFDIDRLFIIREYLEGRTPKTEKDIELISKLLRKIHDNGFVLGDTKLENFIITKNKAYVIDAEQSIKSEKDEYKGWDLLVFFLFLASSNIHDVKKFEALANAFLKKYEPPTSVIKNIFNVRNTFLLSFFPILHLEVLRKITAEFL
jgi:Kae1-associated kinase Bud32